jgi:hypothetical protein
MNPKNAMKLDADETVFFTRELEVVKTATYDVKHSQLKATSLIPVSRVNRGAETITYRVYDMVGVAKIIADYAKDYPRVDVYGTETSVKVKDIGISYGYSIKEIRASQMAEKGLDTRRAQAAKRAIDQKIDAIAWNGDATSNLKGLIGYPGLHEYTIVADGTGSVKTWAHKTADQIARDITGLWSSVNAITNGLEAPDTCIMPLESMNFIATKRMGDGSDKTVLQFVKDALPMVTKWDWVNELNTAGTGSTKMIMMYTRDPMHLTLEIPETFEQFEADKEGTEYNIPCQASCGGVIVYYPLSVGWGYGI